MKTIEEINGEFISEWIKREIVDSDATGQAKVNGGSKTRMFFRIALDVTFYCAIAFVLVSAIIFRGESNKGFRLFGYSWFTVLSDSMEREIPKGSLVLTKKTATGDIRVGDDITFIRSDNETITHRVVGIIENYLESGNRGFITKGTENQVPDVNIVYAANVLGLVKLSVPGLGFTLSYISRNIGIVFLILGGVFVAAVFMRKFTDEIGNKKKLQQTIIRK